MRLPPEVLPISVNTTMMFVALYQHQPGKALYWLGAVILTIGLMMTKG